METSKTPKPCSIEGCLALTHCRGWCEPHYRKWKRYGDPLHVTDRGAKLRVTRGTCLVDGCDQQALTASGAFAGLCSKHYEAARKHGDPLVNRRDIQPAQCTIDGCTDRPMARGWCAHHYGRWKRSGTTDAPAPPPVLLCSTGCGAVVDSLGLCLRHYSRLRRVGSVELPNGEPVYREWCEREGCDRPHWSRGLCRKHYHTTHGHGSWQKRGRWCLTVHELAARDGLRCAIGGEWLDLRVPWPLPDVATVDHIQPLSRGGVDEPWNVQLACRRHNQMKGSKIGWVLPIEDPWQVAYGLPVPLDLMGESS